MRKVEDVLFTASRPTAAVAQNLLEEQRMPLRELLAFECQLAYLFKDCQRGVGRLLGPVVLLTRELPAYVSGRSKTPVLAKLG